jgi:hypothetical protein
VIDLTTGCDMFDVNGNNTLCVEQPCNSFVKNFASLLCALFTKGASRFVTTSGSGVTGVVNDNVAIVTAPAGDVTYGIVLGAGTTPDDDDDYMLEALITHGTDLGMLSYQDCIVSVPTSNALSSEMKISRIVANNGNSPVRVSEVGLIVKIKYSSSTSNFLISRDILEDPIDISPGESARFYVKMKTVV